MPEALVLRALAAARALTGVLGASAPPAGPGPSPTLAPGLSPDDVSPGLAGFIATAAVVAISILLILSLVGRLRRIRHRADVEAREQAARGGGTDPSALGGAPGPVAGTVLDESRQRRAERPEHLE